MNTATKNYSTSRVKSRRRKVVTLGAPLNMRQKRDVKKLISVTQELKYFINNQAGTSVTTTPIVTDLSLIPQGNTDQERTADRLMLCGNLEFHGHAVVAGGATGDIYDTFRIILFQWHPNSVPISSSLLVNGPSGVIDVYSHYSHDNRQEFKIIYDTLFDVVGNGLSASNTYAPNMLRSWSLHIPLTKISKQLQYVGGTTVGTNHIYMLQVTDSSATTHPTTIWSLKLFFKDS